MKILFGAKKKIDPIKIDPVIFRCSKCGNRNELHTLPYNGKFKCDYCSYSVDIDKLDEKYTPKWAVSGFSGVPSLQGGMSGFSGMSAGVPISLNPGFLMPVTPIITIFARNNSDKSVDVELFSKIPSIPSNITVKILSRKGTKILRGYNEFLSLTNMNSMICQINETTDDTQLECYRRDIFEGDMPIPSGGMIVLDGQTIFKLNLLPRQTFTIIMSVTARKIDNFTGF